MFLRSQESLVIPPPLNKCKPASFSSGVGQCIDNILTRCFLSDAAHNPLYPLHPHLQLHVVYDGGGGGGDGGEGDDAGL